MTGLEIVLLVAGFFCLCISFYVAQKKTPEQQEEDVQAAALWSEKEEQMIRERVNEILSDRQNEMVDATEEQMNRLCNDKIMAVDEFSRQILEKIESNHQEVVFMYNMLNEKQKEIKDIMAVSAVQKAEEAKEKAEPAKEKTRQAKPVKKQKTTEPVKSRSVPQKEAVRQPAPAPKTALEQLAPNEDLTMESKAVKKLQEHKPAATSGRKQAEISVPGNVNLQIQKMHNEGKSVLEISKELNIGQGEVKLVIALYGGKKG